MGEDKRRRSGSRSPAPRSGRDAYDDSRGRDGGGRAGGRADSRELTDRGRDRERERDRDRDYDRERVSERDRGDRDREGGRGREAGRDRDPERGPRDGGGRNGDAAAPPRGAVGGGTARGEDSRHHHDEHRGGGGGEGYSREAKRERRDGDDWGQGGPGGGGRREGGGRGGGGRGRDGESSQYMSREEREAKEREAEEAAKPKAPKEQPNLGLSGKLAAETNKAAGGVELKHVPPPEARKPDKRWRLYIFKNDQLQDEPYRIHRMDHYLFGRDVSVADIVTAHPSCSKQHAVLQFRLVAAPRDDPPPPPDSGPRGGAVRPYLLDLGSVNGTFLNGERVEALRYYELLEKDVVKFGQSTREYVLLHDQSGED